MASCRGGIQTPIPSEKQAKNSTHYLGSVQSDFQMCHYTRTHVMCGHSEKLPCNPGTSTCTNKTKPSDQAYTTKADTEKSGKKHRNQYGDFKGEVEPVKDSWCPKCSAEEKAKMVDNLAAGNFNVTLAAIATAHEPNTKTDMAKPTEEKAKDEKGVDAADNDPWSYKVPKWGNQWSTKTRQEVKREVREGKMEMVDQIRVLRSIVSSHANMTPTELEQKIQTQTNARRDVEKIKKEAARNGRKEKHWIVSGLADAARERKAEAKAVRVVAALKRQADRTARVTRDRPI